VKQVFRYDQKGFYVEPVILQNNEPIPSDCTEVKPTDGLYKAKFVGSMWIESLTESEIDSKNAPPQPTEMDNLKAKQALMQQAIDDIILGGAL
jgi:hypothetical protein